MMADLVFDEDASRCAELAKTALDNELLPDDEWVDLVSIYLAALARLGPPRKRA